MGLIEGLRSGFRLYLQQPAFALACTLILSLGLGFSAMLASVVHSLALRPLPFPGADSWMAIEGNRQGLSGGETSTLRAVDFLAFESGQTHFDVLAAYSMYMGLVTGAEGGNAAYVAADVSAGLFELTGVRPLAGRLIQQTDRARGAEPVVVIDADLWQRHFDGRPEAIGATLEVNGRSRTVIGVVPADFAFPHSQKLWLPLSIDPSTPRAQSEAVEIVARLSAGRSATAAASELGALLRQLVATAGPQGSGRDPAVDRIGVSVRPFAIAKADSRLRSAIVPLGMAVLAVLLIACIDVTHLLLGRATRRRRELALRSALGAERQRILARSLGEALAPALVAMLVGSLMAVLGLGAIERLLSAGDMLPAAWMQIRLDPAVLAAMALLTLLVTVLAGTLPAIRAASISPADALRDGSQGNTHRGANRVASILVVAEVALALALLASCGSMLRAVWGLHTFDPGFEAENRLTAKVSLLDRQQDPELFFQRLETRLAARPEVDAVGFASYLPSQGGFQTDWILDRDPERRPFGARRITISPGLFRALGMPITAGRGFDPRLDGPEGPRTAIVNHSFVEHHLGSGRSGPLGQRIALAPRIPARTSGAAGSGGAGEEEDPWLEIVGVVPDTIMGTVDDRGASAAVYLPSMQKPSPAMAMVVSGRNGTPAADSIRRAVSELDANALGFDLRSYDSLLVRRRWLYELFALGFVLFAGAALLLGIGGVYGVVDLMTRQRTREYGIRLALGARPRDLLAGVVRSTCQLLGLGIGLGSILALFTGRLLGSRIHGVEAWNPWVFSFATLLILLAALLACIGPALTASRVDPLRILRPE